MNYKYIIGEIVLIFIGITLSLYFDNWKSNRADKKREIELLTLIAEAIPRDTAKLSVLIKTNDTVAKMMEYLLDTGRYEPTLSKKVTENLGFINHYFLFSPDFSPYENIRQEGMALITNRTLRIDMIRYYDQMSDQKKWTENITDTHFTQFSDYIIDDFDDYQFGRMGIPSDFKKLKENKRFWSLVKRTKMFCEVTSGQMRETKKNAVEFLERIDEEIKNN